MSPCDRINDKAITLKIKQEREMKLNFNIDIEKIKSGLAKHKNTVLYGINIVMMVFINYSVTFGLSNENITILLYTVAIIWFTLFFLVNYTRVGKFL